MLKRFDDFLEKIERAVVIAVFAALIICMALNIIQRNVFGRSTQELQEYLPTMVVWISLIGASLALKEGKHISMEFVLRFVPQNSKDLLHRLAAAFGCVVMLICLYLSQSFMAGELKLFGAKGYISSIIPIFFATAAFRYFILILYPLHQNK